MRKSFSDFEKEDGETIQNDEQLRDKVSKNLAMYELLLKHGASLNKKQRVASHQRQPFENCNNACFY